jgi:transposase
VARKTQRAELSLSIEQRSKLEQISKSRKASLREVQRSQVLLHYADKVPISQIHDLVKVSRPTIYKCIDKALAAGPDAGLRDHYHRPFDPSITSEAKAWVVNLACTKPKDHGLAAELWTLKELAKYSRTYAPEAGHECLSKAVKATIWRILTADAVKPHKIEYYLERRDPAFEQKMQEVLMVYQEVNLQNALKENASSSLITVSVDEKPGVQAIQNIALDLPPKPGKHKSVGGDYEYKRLGTVSILAALDLHDGKIIAQVHERHRSCEFIELLKELDAHYAPECTIRVVLDNHSAHISKETMKYLASRPGRFVYVHTPKHGSWLNLIEAAFSKMARTFLKHVRVSS